MFKRLAVTATVDKKLKDILAKRGNAVVSTQSHDKGATFTLKSADHAHSGLTQDLERAFPNTSWEINGKQLECRDYSDYDDDED